jgi:hypothetical protein
MGMIIGIIFWGIVIYAIVQHKRKPVFAAESNSSLPGNKSKRLECLRLAKEGTERFEQNDLRVMKGIVKEYEETGLIIVDQSSAKSFLGNVQVTVRFRKR